YAEMERWLDRAETVSYLQQPTVARMVVEAIAHRHSRIWNVLEYVVMPNHVHLFFEILGGGLKHTMEEFKRWTGHRGKALLESAEERFCRTSGSITGRARTNRMHESSNTSGRIQ